MKKILFNKWRNIEHSSIESWYHKEVNSIYFIDHIIPKKSGQAYFHRICQADSKIYVTEQTENYNEHTHKKIIILI